MSTDTLRYTEHCAHTPHGWLVSMVLHAAALSVALLLFSELNLASQPEPFHWEIALAHVTPPAKVSPPAPTPPQPKTAAQPPAPAPPKPVEAKPVVREVQTVQTIQQPVLQEHRRPIEQKVQPVVETITRHAEPVYQDTQSVEPETVQSQPVAAVETPSPINPVVEAQSTPVPQRAVVESTMNPIVETQSTALNPVVESQSVPVVQEVVEERPAPTVAHEPVVSQAEPQPIESSPVVAQQPAPEAAPVESPAPPQQVARAPVSQPQAVGRTAPTTAATKADYSWLAQELLARLERSKRYPYAARMNRWEGKVIVRAIVRDDGAVVSLQIAESSGHAVLDNDAMELIRQVSPIKLKHPLGKEQVALLVPVGYSLR